MTASSYSVVDTGSIAAVASHASAVDPHVAAASWIYAACGDGYWGSTATAFAPAWSDYHHFYDSSFTAQWASESGTASDTVSFTYRAGVPVVRFASGSPAVHSIIDGLHTGIDIVAA